MLKIYNICFKSFRVFFPFFLFFYLTVIVSGTRGLGGRPCPGGQRPGGTRPWRSSSACCRYCSCCLSCVRKHLFKSPAKKIDFIQNMFPLHADKAVYAEPNQIKFSISHTYYWKSCAKFHNKFLPKLLLYKTFVTMTLNIFCI